MQVMNKIIKYIMKKKGQATKVAKEVIGHFANSRNGL
jgi:hypothetical protein